MLVKTRADCRFARFDAVPFAVRDDIVATLHRCTFEDVNLTARDGLTRNMTRGAVTAHRGACNLSNARRGARK